MKGTEILRACPPCDASGAEQAAQLKTRRKLFAEHARVGDVVVDWVPLRYSRADSGGLVHEVELQVTADAVRLGERGDSFRPCLTAVGAQAFADALGALLPTSFVCDEVVRQAYEGVDFQGGPTNGLPADALMGSTKRMLHHDELVDDSLIGRGCKGVWLRAIGCKDWVLAAELADDPALRVNYGAHDGSAPNLSSGGLRLWQPEGREHSGYEHEDYSQKQRLVRRACTVGGREMTVDEVLSDPVLWRLCCFDARPGWRGGPVEQRRYWPLPAPRGNSSSPSVASAPRVLREGMSGEDVAEWQRVLGVAADGSFGPRTKLATKALQARHGIAADGVVGPATRAAAKAASAPTSQPPDTLPTGTPTRPLLVRVPAPERADVVDLSQYNGDGLKNQVDLWDENPHDVAGVIARGSDGRTVDSELADNWISMSLADKLGFVAAYHRYSAAYGPLEQLVILDALKKIGGRKCQRVGLDLEHVDPPGAAAARARGDDATAQALAAQALAAYKGAIKAAHLVEWVKRVCDATERKVLGYFPNWAVMNEWMDALIVTGLVELWAPDWTGAAVAAGRPLHLAHGWAADAWVLWQRGVRALPGEPLAGGKGTVDASVSAYDRGGLERWAALTL